MYSRIEINPQVMLGKPVIKGTRLPVYVILESLAAGDTFEEILNAYPFISREDILESLNYAACITKIGFVEYENIEVSDRRKLAT